MKLGAKLNLSFISVVILMLITTVVSLISLEKIHENLDETLFNRVPQVRLVDEIRVNLGMQGLYARSYIIEPTTENENNLKTYANALDDNLTELEKLIQSEQMRNSFNIISKNNDDFNVYMEELIKLVKQQKIDDATELVTGELQVANSAILAEAQEMLKYQSDKLDEVSTSTDESVNFARISSFALFIVAVIVGVLLIVLVRRMITRPLKTLMLGASEISKGDLTHDDIQVKSKDEIGQLANIFNEMKHNLRKIIGSVQNNAENLSAAAEELSASAEEVTATTDDITTQVAMAAELAQTSMRASAESAQVMDETAQGVQRIAEASQELHNASMDASSQALVGKEQLDKAKTQMNVINNSTISVNELVQKLAKQTAEIENITKAITDITDQTNLLALNASIEAARAGEHGKGFAVVADEVKKLAEQSKDSANSIAELTYEISSDTQAVEKAVENAIASVKDGVNIISVASTSFEQIVSSVNYMTEQIQEISATAEELSASAEEVSASVAEMANGASNAADGLTSIAAAMQEQAATMQEVSGVAVSLSDSAVSLQNEVKQFQV